MALTIEQEKRRTDAMLLHLDQKAIQEIYPEVDQVKVVAETHIGIPGYATLHYDFLIRREDSCDMAVLQCENRNCTSGYFYLNEVIKTMFARKEAQREGEIKCSGSDSVNHPNQSCRGVLKYKVKVAYRQSQ